MTYSIHQYLLMSPSLLNSDLIVLQKWITDNQVDLMSESQASCTASDYHTGIDYLLTGPALFGTPVKRNKKKRGNVSTLIREMINSWKVIVKWKMNRFHIYTRPCLVSNTQRSVLSVCGFQFCPQPSWYHCFVILMCSPVPCFTLSCIFLLSSSFVSLRTFISTSHALVSFQS